jgi:hypothetical protein
MLNEVYSIIEEESETLGDLGDVGKMACKSEQAMIGYLEDDGGDN